MSRRFQDHVTAMAGAAVFMFGGDMVDLLQPPIFGDT
jgi:hypothetical protein